MRAGLAQLESYLDSFTEFAQQTTDATPPWLRALREAAFARFCAVGFPTTHDEDWRFTNVSAIAQTPFQLAREGTTLDAVPDLGKWRMRDAAARMVFWNGRLAPALSTWRALPAGITVNGLEREIAHSPESLSAHLGRYLDIERDPFNALNTAFAQDGGCIRIGRGVVLEQPIHLLFISAPEGAAPVMTHPRNLIIVEDNAQATIIEDYVSFGVGAPALTNTATEMVVGNNATVVHTAIERENSAIFHVATLRVQQARSANVASHSLLAGGALVRSNVHPVLAGEGGECLINGLFLGSGRQHLDNYMLVEHASPHCASRQFYNGILDGHAHGVFHGRIVVRKGAQKTDAKQTNRNLLLSDDARIDSKPQLEIYADDVKCTHGATTGQIDEGALFYLRSRGLDETSARRLLIGAFAGEWLGRIAHAAARDLAEEVVARHFRVPAEPNELERTRGEKSEEGA